MKNPSLTSKHGGQRRCSWSWIFLSFFSIAYLSIPVLLVNNDDIYQVHVLLFYPGPSYLIGWIPTSLSLARSKCVVVVVRASRFFLSRPLEIILIIRWREIVARSLSLSGFRREKGEITWQMQTNSRERVKQRESERRKRFNIPSEVSNSLPVLDRQWLFECTFSLHYRSSLSISLTWSILVRFRPRNTTMEASLGRGYSIHEDFGVTDFYSPPSSLIDETEEQDDDLFYPEDEEHSEQPSIVPTQETILPSSLIEEISSMNLSESFIDSARLHSSLPIDALKSPSLKLISTGSTPPPTPLVSYRPFIPASSTATTTSFPTMTMNTHLPVSPPRSTAINLNNWSLGTSTTEIRNSSALFSRPVDSTPKTATAASSGLLTPTSIDRYFASQRRLSDSTSRSSTSKIKSQCLKLTSFFCVCSSTRTPDAHRSTSLSLSKQTLFDLSIQRWIEQWFASLNLLLLIN